MKKLLAIVLTICMLASVLCLPAFAADDAPAPGVVLRIRGEKDSDTLVKVADHTNFEDGWNAAMELANKNTYNRVVVDIYTDWEAVNGEFTDDWINGKGFDNDTIYIPADAKVTLNLNGHTIDRGLTKDTNDGEVIFINDDADVIINNGTITGGYSNSEGAGLYVEGGAKVTLNDVHIIGNRTYIDDGAGIYMYGKATLIMNGGSLSDNAITTLECDGGAVYLDNSNATFTGVEFKNNKATRNTHGTIIYANDSEVEIDQCTFDGNSNGTSAVCFDDCEVTLSNSTFTNNGCSELFEIESTDINIDKCVIKNNTSSFIIRPVYGSDIQIFDSQFTDNESCVITTGWDIFMGEVTFNNCTFNNNTSSYGTFHHDLGNITFYDCSFGNSTFDKAENVIVKYTDTSMEEVVIKVTVIAKDGTQEVIGYKFFDFGWDNAMISAQMSHNDRVIIDLYADWNAVNGVFGTLSSFKWNTLYVHSGTNITLNLNGYTINRGLDKEIEDGEVMYVASGAEITINNGTITGGYSDNGAGGIHINSNAKVTLNNVNVVKNKVQNDDGAGIAIYGGTLTVNNGSISDNVSVHGFLWAHLYGGGIYAEKSTVVLEGVTLKNNSFESENKGDKIYGSAIYSDDSTVKLINCTVEGNGVTSDDSKYFCTSTIYADDSTLVIENTNFVGNGSKNNWQPSETSDFYHASAVISIVDTDITITGGKFTDNRQVYLFYLRDAVINVDGADFTGNDSLALNVHDACSTQSTFSNCKFSAGSAYAGFKYDFKFDDDNAKITFVDCEFGKATFNNKKAFKFIGGSVSNGVGSIFGEGSLTMIVAFFSFIISVASISLTVAYNKKKTVPVTANAAETEDEDE